MEGDKNLAAKETREESVETMPNFKASENIEDGGISSARVSAMEEDGTTYASDATQSSSSASVATQLASTNVPAPLEKFTLFPKLPIELRLKIWDEAMPGPRVIELLVHHGRNGMGDPGIAYTDCKTPSILHASRESRNHVLKKYKTLATMDRDGCSIATWRLLYTRIDFDQDIVYFSLRTSPFDPFSGFCGYQTTVYEILPHLSKSNPQHIALNFEETKSPALWGHDSGRLKKLKTIAIVASDICMPYERHVPNEALKDITSRPIIGHKKNDPAENIEQSRCWSGDHVETFDLGTSFDEVFETFSPAFRQAMIQKGADEALVNDLDFIGIDIIRYGENSENSEDNEDSDDSDRDSNADDADRE
ncbi:hypothetical protein BDZ45DRAFT_741754 [Acephala macrosclerotiorum]|nr:hypothetical protein BDZ45DRAFT_741754 [Acephala macrosclerotiorum]